MTPGQSSRHRPVFGGLSTRTLRLKVNGMEAGGRTKEDEYVVGLQCYGWYGGVCIYIYTRTLEMKSLRDSKGILLHTNPPAQHRE